MKFKFLTHTADIKFQAFGNSIEEAFENSAYALIEIMCKNKVKDALVTKIKVTGKDYESLLYNFLEEFLFLIDSENFILNKINRISKIRENKNGEYEITADLSGDDAKNYEFSNSIKAITYNDMFVKPPKSFDKKFIASKILKDTNFSSHEKQKWVCQVVVDV
jgi:SHS2 domain-containing protein